MSVIPKIYIACLASYNAGILHGEWIDLDGSEDITERIEAILGQSSIEDAEEWAVHDHEFCGSLGEYPGLAALEALSDAFIRAENEGIEWELFCEFCDHAGHDLDPDTVSKFSEAYAGSDNSLVDWCHDFLDETGQLESIPENLRFYFDYGAFARDLEISDVFTIEHDGETHVFWNH